MKYEQKVQIETSEYICLVKRIDGVVAQKTLEQELIRCKDCKHWDEEDHVCGLRDCYGWDYTPDSFCSWAERKECDSGEE